MDISYKYVYNIKYVTFLTLSAGIISSFFSVFSNNFIHIGADIFHGFMDGAIIGFLITFFKFFIMDTFLKKYTRKAPFVFLLIFNTAAYLFLILLGRASGITLTNRGGFELFPFYDRQFTNSLVFGLVAVFMMTLLIQNNRLLGPRVLFTMISGRYHQPRAEIRYILFLDLADSTAIAEKIGNASFLELLDDFFFELTEPLLETRGEIYKYVGDEVIISWSFKKGRTKYNCLRFLDLFGKRIGASRRYFEKKYGLVPRYRAGLHLGEVQVGEMGDIKQEIALLGDTMNTAARITYMCKELKKGLLVSKECAVSLPEPVPYSLENLGGQKLRGKEKKLVLYSLDL